MEAHKDSFHISTAKEKLDRPLIHHFLSTEAYWCRGIPRETVERSIRHSLCFGVYKGNQQVGFARVISDFATIAYLGDVFILKDFRGQGLSKWLLQTIHAHPDLQGLRRWILLTADAHSLYRQAGWSDLADPTKWMEIHHQNPYG